MLHFLIIIKLLLITQNVLSYSCPEYLKTNSEAQELFSLLKEHKNKTFFKGCEVYVKLCDESSYSNKQFVMAEFLVKNVRGNVGYVPIMFFDTPKKYYSTSVETYRNSYNYHLFDKANESIFGSFQMWDLRFVYSDDDPAKLSKIELGVYAENKRLRMKNGNDSLWFVCNEETALEFIKMKKKKENKNYKPTKEVSLKEQT